MTPSDRNTIYRRRRCSTQCDHLIVAVVDAAEGDQEAEIVRHLLRLRDSMTPKDDNREWGVQVEAVRAEMINVVNNFFYKRLAAVPTIGTYIDGFSRSRHTWRG